MGTSDPIERIAGLLDACNDLQAVVDAALGCGLRLTGADRGNLQLMDWKLRSLTIAAHRGFDSDFLDRFARVNARDGTACGRTIREGRCVIVEDVFADPEFAPHQAIADQVGFRAVQSTPLISRSGAFLGVLSTHFSARHRARAHEIRALKTLAEITATAIILQRIRVAQQANDQVRIADSLAAVDKSWELLGRASRKVQKLVP